MCFVNRNNMLQTIGGGVVRKETRTVFRPNGEVISQEGHTVGVAVVRADTPDYSVLARMEFGELGEPPRLPKNAIIGVESATDGNKVSLLARSESGRPGERFQASAPDGTGIVLQGLDWAAVLNVSEGTRARVMPGRAARVGSVVINNLAKELVINFT